MFFYISQSYAPYNLCNILTHSINIWILISVPFQMVAPSFKCILIRD